MLGLVEQRMDALVHCGVGCEVGGRRGLTMGDQRDELVLAHRLERGFVRRCSPMVEVNSVDRFLPQDDPPHAPARPQHDSAA
jgi:hypothetical protein